MNTTVIDATDYRNVPLALLTESKTNPRRSFEHNALHELAKTIQAHEVLSPLLVRPLTEQGFEIVFGARRYRAAHIAEVDTVPVRIKNMTDAEAIEAQLIENLQRPDVHPMEEASGFRALLDLEEPKYSIEQISAKTAKSPVYVASRLKLTELTQNVADAFYREEIGSAMRSCWRSSNPTSRNWHLPLASKRIGAREGRSRNPFFSPSAACNSGLRATFFSS